MAAQALEECPTCHHAKLPGRACMVCDGPTRGRALAEQHSRAWRMLEFAEEAPVSRRAIVKAHRLHLDQLDEVLAFRDDELEAYNAAVQAGPVGLGLPWPRKASG